MKKENKILEAATEKRKRGRPSIDIGVTSCLDGTRRTQVNAKYMFEAVSLISEAASEIPDNHLLWYSDDKTQRAAGKHGILEQIGRMWLQDASDPIPGSGTAFACRGGYGRSFCIAPRHSVAMIDLSKVRNYYVACGYTDLRLGIDGLAAVVAQQYGSHFNEESLFLFCGRRTDRIKALYWCGEGYILLYKRLSNGRFQWPRSEAELRLLDPQSFRWLMEGLKVEQKTAIRKGKPKDLF